MGDPKKRLGLAVLKATVEQVWEECAFQRAAGVLWYAGKTLQETSKICRVPDERDGRLHYLRR